MSDNIIKITLDDGFNGIKAVVNKRLFFIPSDVIKVDFATLTTLSSSQNEDNLRYVSGTNTYLVGAAARRLLIGKKEEAGYKEKIEGLVSEKRIVTDEYTVGLETTIALALYNCAAHDQSFDLNDLSKYEIHLSVALPHRVSKEYMPSIVANMSKRHKFQLTIGATEHNFDFTIKEENIVVYSQVIAAILGELLDDDGNPCLDESHPLNQLPTLVCDGGWYTFGIANVRDGLTIYDNEAESNSCFAMNNIYELACENIKAISGLNFVPREIEDRILKHDVNQRYKDKDGSWKSFNLEVEREKASEIIVDKFLEYLDKRYDDLVYTKNILLTGGTGAASYSKVRQKRGPVLGEEHILLTEGKFNGEKVDPMYAIAVGAYKALCGVMNN